MFSVFQLYSKGGGKNGRHKPVTESPMITAISYLSVEVFENHHATVFSIPTATSFLRTKQFAHIPSNNLLCVLSQTPKPLPTGLSLFPEDAERFKILQRGVTKFHKAMVLFRKRGKNEEGNRNED
ncbi:hypothetical protein C8J57DRAFT_1070505 [Mycena rebaudengoi]|nr:hypothetical protein C8J57DRAFT_1070505 [Mycena rebaudengoi]